MENQFLQILIPAIGLVSGLIGAYVGLQNRVLLAEVRKELAEMEHRLFLTFNGTYVRQAECNLREVFVMERLNSLVEEAKSKNAAGL